MLGQLTTLQNSAAQYIQAGLTNTMIKGEALESDVAIIAG
jgi:hypothetical protein